MDGRCDVHGGGELGASAACVSSTDSGDRDLLRSPIDFRFRIFLGHRDRGHGLLHEHVVPTRTINTCVSSKQRGHRKKT